MQRRLACNSDARGATQMNGWRVRWGRGSHARTAGNSIAAGHGFVYSSERNRAVGRRNSHPHARLRRSSDRDDLARIDVKQPLAQWRLGSVNDKRSVDRGGGATELHDG